MIILALCALLSKVQAAELVAIQGYHIEETKEFTHITINANQHPDYRILALEHPNRIAIDIKHGRWDAEEPTLTAQRISRVRYAQNTPETLRIVLDLNQPALIKKHAVLLPPTDRSIYTLSLVIQATDPKLDPFSLSTSEANTSRLVPLLKPTTSHLDNFIIDTRAPLPILKKYTLDQLAPAFKPLIIIDAGHGGHDPGSISRKGTQEKDITLSFSRELKKRLLLSGNYRVYMTRDHDQYIDLQERVRRAENADGDMFISLHADSHNNPLIRGLSVYTLSETASDREADALAKNANRTVTHHVLKLDQEDDLTPLLIDMVQRNTKNISASFAEKLVHQLKQHVTLLRNTHRFAGFRVLTSASIPSVLIELGYMSNRQEETLLLSQDYRTKLVNSIAKAIDIHFKTHQDHL